MMDSNLHTSAYKKTIYVLKDFAGSPYDSGRIWYGEVGKAIDISMLCANVLSTFHSNVHCHGHLLTLY